MNLREVMDDNDCEGLPDKLTGREDFLWMGAYVKGWAQANGRKIVTSTRGPTMRIHDLDNDTRSMLIQRRDPITSYDLRLLVQSRLDAIDYWEQESDNWGPDPWAAGANIRRKP